jgi:hypothetical protein
MRTNLPSGVIPISTHRLDFACGHEGPRTFDFVVNGLRIYLKQVEERRFFTEKDLCPACTLEKVERMIIYCCRCGRMIFPGEGIALYVDERMHGPFQPDHMRTWNRKWIGCIDRTCCPDVNRFAVAGWDSSGLVPYRDRDLPPDA